MDNFAESSKRKAAVWPLQIMLLILCPVRPNTFNCYTVIYLIRLNVIIIRVKIKINYCDGVSGDFYLLSTAPADGVSGGKCDY